MRQYYIQLTMSDDSIGYWSEDSRGAVQFNSILKTSYTKEQGIQRALALSKEFKTIFSLCNKQGNEIKSIRKEILKKKY